MMLKTLSTMLLLASAAPAIAQGASASSADSKASNPNKIVCERYEETGSRLASRRVCKTVREWEEQSKKSRAAAAPKQQSGGAEASN